MAAQPSTVDETSQQRPLKEVTFSDSGSQAPPLSAERMSLSKEELQNEFKVFAETLLQEHLTELATCINTCMREELQKYLKEQQRRPSPSANKALSPDSRVQMRWSNSRSNMSDTGCKSDDLGTASQISQPKPKIDGKRRQLAYARLRTSTHTLDVLDDVSSSAYEDGRSRQAPDSPLRSSACSTDSLPSEVPNGQSQAIARKIVRSSTFEDMVTVMILLNAVYIGVGTDYMARHDQSDPPQAFHIIDTLFMLFFAIEIALKLFVYRLNLFRFQLPGGYLNKSVYWNLLDTVVVGLQVVEFMFRLIGVNAEVIAKVTIVRLLRSVRLIRVVRLLKVLRFVRDLRMIVYSITRSFSLFFWSCTALFLLTFLWSVYFTELVLAAKVNYSVDDPYLDHYFNSLTRTFLSLILAVTGGVDWGELADALALIGHVPGSMMLLLYVTFTLLAVMNVITGVFLDTSLERAKREREVFLMRNARVIFEAADNSRNGMINWEDFKAALKHEHINEFFEAIDIDASQAKNLFDLLDASGDGCISSEEFLHGCLRLRGAAKALDLLVLSREVQQHFDRHRNATSGAQDPQSQDAFVRGEATPSLGLKARLCSRPSRLDLEQRENGDQPSRGDPTARGEHTARGEQSSKGEHSARRSVAVSPTQTLPGECTS